MRPKAEWAIDSEAMRARGIIVLVKSNYLIKNIDYKDANQKMPNHIQTNVKSIQDVVKSCAAIMTNIQNQCRFTE